MNRPPRLVLILSFVQAFFVTTGYLVTRALLKGFDQVWSDMLGLHPSALLQFIRSYGLWCLLVPLTWSLFAASRADTSGGIASLTIPDFGAGIVLTLSLAVLFSIGALQAIHLVFGPV